ncbi:transcriptional regulator [Embleya hyalina]|uniref:transcriptional regulator n=1 Tax=Embleya hyalina TaxID=516124 RepID=UPI00147782D5|nr:transcriptional regulator [Embleya hyalina]
MKDSAGRPGGAAVPESGSGPGRDDGVTVVGPPPDPAPTPARRRRTAVGLAAAAAVLGAALVVAYPLSGDGGDDSGAHKAADSGPAPTAPPAAGDRPASASPSTAGTGSASASTDTTPPGKVAPGASKGGTPSTGASSGNDPLGVAVRPYVYSNPCSQHFLVDSAPEQVGPPANEGDAVRWSGAYGAVSSDEQQIALTVQGRDRDTVVLEALHVRVVAKGAPLAWNDYSMGVGCGGDVDTKSFDIDLDRGSPTVTTKNGQRDFPYKVSATDPEVFYVTVHTRAHDVRWDLTLDWSTADGRRGTVKVDNKGKPFRTSAGSARPGYDYPLGGGEWIKRAP